MRHPIGSSLQPTSEPDDGLVALLRFLTKNSAASKLDRRVRTVLAIWMALALACASAFFAPPTWESPSHVDLWRPASQSTDSSGADLDLAGYEAAPESTEEEGQEEEASSLEEDALPLTFASARLVIASSKLPRMFETVRYPPADTEPDTPPPRC